MTTRFWQPDNETSSDDLSLVACVASNRCLYVVVEGPALPPPPDPYSDAPESLWMHVATASGVQLSPYGMSGDFGKDRTGRPRHYLANFTSPPEPSEPLTVKLLEEDGSPIWEVQAIPVN